MKEKIRVLQIVTELTWRGGENQLRLLMESSLNDCRYWLAAPASSQARRRLAHVSSWVRLERSSFRAIFGVLRLVRLCRRESIEVVDCQSSKAHSVGILLKLLVPNLKLVVHRRVDFLPSLSWPSRWKYLHPAVDRYVAISQAIEKLLLDYGLEPSRLSMVRSAVERSVFAERDRLSDRQEVLAEFGGRIQKNDLILINVAYQTHQKDQHTLIRALPYIRSGNWKLLLAGDGPLRPELEALVSELGLDTRVVFLGVRQDVAKLLSASDIFVMSSRFEGLGTSILDAMHSELAIVATRVGGIPELIEGEVDGLLVDKEQANELAEALERLIVDENLRLKLAARAYQKAAESYSLEAMVEGNLQVYRQLART